MNPNASTPVSLEVQVREAAYFQWLDRGCPPGDDWTHWFAAEKQFQSVAPAGAAHPAHSIMPAFSSPTRNPGIGATHLKHSAKADQRPGVLASGAMQRTRASHPMGGPRPTPRT